MKNDLIYTVVREKRKKIKIKFNKKLEGYELINNRKKVINGVSVNNIIVLENNLIKKTINKKVDKKFKRLLELIASIYETDESPGDNIRYALNEIEKFKRMMINQYIMYMDKKQIDKLNRKIKLIEQEVGVKLYQYSQVMEEEYETEKTSHRRR